MPVIINEFEIDIEPPARNESAQGEKAGPAKPREAPGPSPMAIRDMLEQMRERELRLEAW